MDETLIALKRLVEEAHVRLDVLAQLCNCTSVSIRNYALGNSLPNGTKYQGLVKGLKAYKEMINDIIKD